MGNFLFMPRMDVSMTEGTIAEWKAAQGSAVNKGQILLTVESGKSVDDVASPYDGTLLKIFHEDGTDVEVGALLAYIGEPGEHIPDIP